MNENLKYVVEILEELSSDLPSKPRARIDELILNIKKLPDELSSNDIIKLQDEIEFISNMANVDFLTRTELSNLISDLECLL